MEKNEMKKSIFILVQSKRKPFFHFPLLCCRLSQLAPTANPHTTLFLCCRLIYHLGWWFCLMCLLSPVVVQYSLFCCHRRWRRRFLFIKSLPVHNDFSARRAMLCIFSTQKKTPVEAAPWAQPITDLSMLRKLLSFTGNSKSTIADGDGRNNRKIEMKKKVQQKNALDEMFT